MDIKQEQLDMKERNLTGRTVPHAATPQQFRDLNQRVLELLHAEPRLTLQEIANAVGRTRQRIEQINKKLGEYGRVGREPRDFVPNKDAFVEYRAYVAARARCNNPKHPRFNDYGARGIEFRFTSFMEMFNEIGHRPKDLTPAGKPVYSLNRIDNNGHYAPGNVEWATQEKQCTTGSRRKKSRKSPVVA